MPQRNELLSDGEYRDMMIADGTALNRAIEACGSTRELARRLRNISQPAISKWERVPADRCIQVEKACEGKVTRYEMRPDVFGTRKEAAADFLGSLYEPPRRIIEIAEPILDEAVNEKGADHVRRIWKAMMGEFLRVIKG